MKMGIIKVKLIDLIRLWHKTRLKIVFIETWEFHIWFQEL
jgi:hypothetical protein